MKKLFILCIIMLIVSLSGALLVSCQQQPEPTPAPPAMPPTPIAPAPAPPAPTPIPTPTPIAPTPTPTSPPTATEEASLSVKIPPIEVAAGETLQLEVIATDQHGNSMSDVNVAWIVIDKNAGSVTQAGLFTAGEVVRTFSNAVEVQVSKGELVRSAMASVTITPGPLEQVVIAPNPAEIGLEMTQQFVAVGADRYGNRIANLAFSWSVETGGGTVDETGLFTGGAKPGTYEDTVKAEATREGATRSGSANVTVETDRILFISRQWDASWDEQMDIYVPKDVRMGGIYVMDADGSNVKQLTDTFVTEGKFSCSPDGQHVVYETGDSQDKIIMMNTDGSGKRCLSGDDTKTRNHDPAWSPDGSKIAFGRDFDIYVIDVYTDNLTRLTETANFFEYSPAWSPDSSKIVFTRSEDEPENFWAEDSDIFVMDADGGNLTQFTDTSEINENSPAWSPDRVRIMYQVGNNIFYVIDADGSNLKHLDVNVGCPMWSPDGTQIVFTRDYGYEIYVMNADRSDRSKLTPSDELIRNVDPSWSPNGSKIVFVSELYKWWQPPILVPWAPPSKQMILQEKQIYIMDADGSHKTQITDNKDKEMSPQWVPRKRGVEVTEDSVVIPGARILKK